MEKRKLKVAKEVEEKKDGKVERVGEAKRLANVSWNQNDFLVELNNFIETRSGGNESGKNLKIQKLKMMSELANSRRNVYFLSEKLSNSKIETELLAQNNKGMMQKLFDVQNHAKTKVDDLAKKKRQVEEKLKRLSLTYERNKRDLQKATQQSEMYKAKLSQLSEVYSSKLDAFRRDYEDRFSGKQKALNEKFFKLQEERNTMQLKVNELLDNLSFSNEKTAELNKKIEYLKAEKHQMIQSKDLNSRVSKERKHEIDRLNNEIAKYKADYIKANEERDLKYAEVKSLNLKIQELSYLAKSQKEQIEGYLTKISTTRAESKDKDLQINALNDRILEFKEKTMAMQSMEKRLTETNIKAAELENTVEKNQGDIFQYKKEISDYLSQIDRQAVQIEALKAKEDELVEKLNSTKAKHKSRIDVLNSRVNELEGIEAGYVADVESLKRQMSEAGHALDLAKQKSETFQKEIKEHKNEIERLISLKDKNQNMGDEILAHKASIADLRQDLALSQNEITQLKQEIDKKEDYNAKLENGRQLLKDQMQELISEIEHSKNENQSLEQTISQLGLAVSGKESEVLSLQQEIQDLKAEMENLDSIAEQERVNVDILKAEIQDVTTENNELKMRSMEFSELGKNWDTEKEVLDLKINDMTEELNLKVEEIHRLKSEFNQHIGKQSSIAAENNKLFDKISSLEGEQDRLNAVIEKNTITTEDLKSQLEAARLEIGSQKSTISFLEDSAEVAKKTEESLTKSIQVLRDEKEKIISENNTVVQDLKHEIVDFRRQKKGLESKIDGLRAKIHDYESSDRGQSSEIAQLSDKLKDAKTKVQELETEKSHLNSKLVDAQRRLDFETDNIRSLKAVNSEMKTKLDAVEKDFGSLEKEAFDLRSYKTRLEKQRVENEKALEELQAKESSFKKLQSENIERENKLNLYSRWVDSQKERLQDHIVNFVQELRLSHDLNPLKSYLVVTEKEISKIEKAMAKSSIFGRKKAVLDENLKQLTKQKDYIVALLEKSEIELHKRSQAILDELKTAEFMPAPPLPPKG